MLRACKRILRPGGRIALTTIEWAPGLTPAQRRASRDAAPRAVGSRRPYADLLAAAGFVDVGARDVTGEFLATTRAWLTTSEPVRDRLAETDGETVVEERLQGWRDNLGAIQQGHLKRTIYWAVRA